MPGSLTGSLLFWYLRRPITFGYERSNVTKAFLFHKRNKVGKQICVFFVDVDWGSVGLGKVYLLGAWGT
jgi:hypothetical protein